MLCLWTGQLASSDGGYGPRPAGRTGKRSGAPGGAGTGWSVWQCQNGLCMQTGRSQTHRSKQGYANDMSTCERREMQTLERRLVCRLLGKTCTKGDVAAVTQSTITRAQFWKSL